ncbi:hypothetical protein [Coleofasciculus sp. FACHB-SPT9]|uniref:hypothetical protein n=1 Tax=Cyanophyceae TaxID=3028117 RepID=UPI00168969D7|nr:hypothetical protein [Coleofasciculus sp. FACHB-SPT9]MBD1890515.1 hypothetical protein [Coleofasciculus sp. FACHB-SPT9]
MRRHHYSQVEGEADRTSDIELQKLAQRHVKPNSQVWEEEELVEDLKRRRQQKRSQK